MNIFNYKTYIFDFDGVILDSNFIKKQSISLAVDSFLDEEKKKIFINYFIDNSGIPREKKISKFFDKNKSSKILSTYESYLNEKLIKAKFVKGVIKFIKKLHKKNKIIFILSGGEQKEILKLLQYYKMIYLFDGIYGGPNNKNQNLKIIKPLNPVIFFGDSEHDFLVSKEHNFDFIFVSDYTSLKNWKNVIKKWIILKEIKNFNFL